MTIFPLFVMTSKKKSLLIFLYLFLQLLEKGTKMVLEQAVTTLASVADTAEDKFVQYYDR